MRILVVEDEKKVARALQEGLQGEGYEVSVVGSGEDGFFLKNTEAFDMVILDLKVRDSRGQPRVGGAGVLVSQMRIGGARGCPAKTANRASDPSSAGGAAIAEGGGA